MLIKFHTQMTLFATFIITITLTLMTMVCLFIAETGTRDTAFASFKDNANSCISHLENQNLISHQWLLKAEADYDIRLQILDNGRPLYFQSLNPNPDDTKAMEKAAEISKTSHSLDLTVTGNRLTKCAFFRMKNYYAATALVSKEHGTLSVIILHPLDTLTKRIRTQRLFFICVVLAAIFVLAVFSWFFTKRMIRPLEESRRRQTEFIAAASHELRSPLTVILSSISALRKAEPESREHFLGVIENESTRMSRLVGDMLSLANADNHSWSLVPAPCELDTLLLDTYEKYEPLMEKAKLKFRIRLPEAAVTNCICDSARISQVLGILLDNAMSYVPENSQVTLSLQETETHFCLTVSDNGPGISDEGKKAIFQRFYRADAARNDKQHFGLGLCIAKEIATLHGGAIEVTDTQGGGASFIIRLPK